MAKPFSDLEQRALAILASGGDPTTSQDKNVARYWAWRIDPSSESHKLPNASIRTSGRKLDDVAVNPFSIEMAGGALARVTISQRSLNNFAEELKNVLNHKDITTDTPAYRLARFSPAKVYVRTGASQTPEPRTSRITGREYKSYYAREDPGYSMPFGQSNEGHSFEEAKTSIEVALRQKDTSINLISFTPEKAR